MTTLLAAAVLIGTLAVARATRLATEDSFPPIERLRAYWFRVVREEWQPLLQCAFCFAPYAAAVDLTWGWTSHSELGAHSPTSTAWWVVNLWAASSYAAAMIVARDTPEDR